MDSFFLSGIPDLARCIGVTHVVEARIDKPLEVVERSPAELELGLRIVEPGRVPLRLALNLGC